MFRIAAAFDYLDAPILRVAGADVPMPYSQVCVVFFYFLFVRPEVAVCIVFDLYLLFAVCLSLLACV